MKRNQLIDSTPYVRYYIVVLILKAKQWVGGKLFIFMNKKSAVSLNKDYSDRESILGENMQKAIDMMT